MPKNNLTPKQRAFIAEYLLCRNATRAAIQAGYSPKTARSAGSRLLTNADIKRAIEKGLAEQLERADISANNVLLELRKIAFSESLDSRKLRALELLGKSLGIFNGTKRSAKKPVLTLDVPFHKAPVSR